MSEEIIGKPYVIAEAEARDALVDVDFHDLCAIFRFGVPEDVVLNENEHRRTHGLRFEP